MKFNITIPLLLFMFLLQWDAGHSNDSVNHYQVKLKLDPASRHMKVKTNLRFISREPLPDTLVFNLHMQFTGLKVTGNGIGNFTFDTESPPPSIYTPQARPLRISLEKNSIQYKELLISFEYEGILSEWPDYSANVITEDWVELGMYLPWYPQIFGSFTYEIEAECDPAYELRSFGDYSRRKGIWYFNRMTPTYDMVLVASKTLRTMKQESGKNTVYIHYQGLQDTTAEKLATDLIGIFDLFVEWFGGREDSETITLIESPREKGGGYNHNNLIVLAGLSDEKYFTQHEYFIRYLAHETAHFWWHMASVDTWEDWMNEGFAEYSALLIIEELFGEDSFNKRLEDKKKNMGNTPPIWGFNRSDMTTSGQAEIVEANLYSKGPVILDLLSKRIGSDGFKAMCKEMIESNISSTNELLDLIEKNDGIEVRGWFENLIKTY